MVLKKGMFENYVKERETPVNATSTKGASSKYSHNRVFDEPVSLKSLINQEDFNELSYNTNSSLDQNIQCGSNQKSFIGETDNKVMSTLLSENTLNQPSDKENTKGTQRGYKGDTKGITKGLQRGHSEEEKETQRDYKGNTKGLLKGTHKGLQRGHKISSLNTDKKGLQREHKYSQLRGWNKKIIDLIHEICKETVSKITYPLTNSAIAEMLDIPSHSIKTTMQRLKAKGYILVAEFNDGRGGWSRYTLPEEFFNEIPLTERVHKGITKGTQRDYKGDTKGNTQGDTNTSSSSSNDLINKTTTTELPNEWNFDITSYARFGFTATQLKQLAPLGVISANDVEQSLIEFSFDLDNNLLPPIKTTKINFLMGLFRSGSSYVSGAFKNEQDAMIAEMARRSVVKRENLLKAKFEAWEGNLNDAERRMIESKLPPHLMVRNRAHGISDSEVKNWLFEYYLQVTS